MKIRTPIYCYLMFVTIAITSCKKISGSATTAAAVKGTSTGSTGTATFALATGTVIFTVENVGTYTWTSSGLTSAYFLGLGTTPTTGQLAFPGPTSTIVTAGPTDTQQFLTTGFTISFAATTAGTYPAGMAGSGIRLPSMTLNAAGGTEVVTVTSENITITSTDYGTVKGSVKGTFDGKMMNMSTNALVKVSGSFDVSIK